MLQAVIASGKRLLEGLLLLGRSISSLQFDSLPPQLDGFFGLFSA